MGSYYRTQWITEKEKIYGSIFSVTISPKIKEISSFELGNFLLNLRKILFMKQHFLNFIIFRKKGIRKVL